MRRWEQMNGKFMIVIIIMLMGALGMIFSGILMFSGCSNIAPSEMPISPATQTPFPPQITPSTPLITPSPPLRYPIVTYAPPTTRYGNFQLLISDDQSDIADFESLTITISHARVFKLGDNNSEAGFRVLDLNRSTPDLTQLTGKKALPILDTSLEIGNYSKIELYVENVDARLERGETAEVQIPNEKLQIVKPFEITEEETTKFVFDMNVVRQGLSNEYNLLPVISESGVVGKEISEDKVIEI
jgi:hypothetical protein